jgi:hypothetical protein
MAAVFVSMGRNVSDWDKQEVFKRVTAASDVHIDRGIAITEEEHHPWYMKAKQDIEGIYWTSYSQFLTEKHWPKEVINEMDEETDEIMDLLGNPNQAAGFQRRGLCIGDVQSGKTANYIGLMNKAADAGYKVIILLTGVIEKLRSQTQGRVDEGFIGRDSNAFQQNKTSKIGVGVYRSEANQNSACLTSKSKDFKLNIAKSLNIKIGSFKGTSVFVLKKNKNTLETLQEWLQTYNLGSNRRINQPMLLIDDEADNASVNTKKPEDATRINRDIRTLLSLFTKSSYLGYTATPYANIFIDPDTDDEMLHEDLFPRHFIYCLPTPTNYIGPASVFLDADAEDALPGDGIYSSELKNNDDCDTYLPLKHKKESPLGDYLPQSLEEAILSFFLVNAIRDLRKQDSAHRTMMVNISRFINVQNRIRDDVAWFVKDCINEIGNYYMRDNGTEQSECLARLKELYDNEFKGFAINGKKSEINYDWLTVQHALKKAVASIQIESVNGGNASEKLDYEENPDGKRLIAIGGLSLSRGLTLEGLCISYFYRNSKAYDTLMQMGRWFGYRAGYDDLCRIWMPHESVDWYTEITTATRELKQRLLRMKNERRTPEDFGLCVRQDSTALLVTARNKMKTAQDFSRQMDLSGNVVETKYLSNNDYVLNTNFNRTDQFVRSLVARDYSHISGKNKDYAVRLHQFLNVDGNLVIQFLGDFKSHPMNFDFDPKEIVKAIQHAEKIRKAPLKWDVIIAQGKETTFNLGGIPIPMVQRNFKYQKGYRALQISGKNAHLGSKHLAKAGMTKSEAAQLEKRYEDEQRHQSPSGKIRSTSARTYFQYPDFERNPVLMIYPLKLPQLGKKVDDLKDEERRTLLDINNRHPLIGLGIGMPVMKGLQSFIVNYKINRQMQRELFDIEPEEDFEEIDDTIPEE